MKDTRDFKPDDFIHAFKGYHFAMLLLLLVSVLQCMAYFAFYKVALPSGFTNNMGMADLEALLFALSLLGVVLKALSHQYNKKTIDAFTLLTLCLVAVPDGLLAFGVFDYRLVVIRSVVILAIVFVLFVLMLFLNLRYD